MKPKTKRILSPIFKWFLIVIVAFIILLPLLWIFTSSISPADELFSSPIHYLPKHPTLDNYVRIFTQMNLGEKILNTTIITVCSLILSTVICLMAAYAFTRYSGKGLTLVYAAIVASALIPGIVTARPLYDLMKKFGLIDTFPGLIIMYTSALIPFTMLILGNFLSEIPVSLDEAAEIDGATGFRRFKAITWPLLKPTTMYVFIIALTSAFKTVDHLYIMTKGGPGNATNMLLFYIYQTGFDYWNNGKASAMTVILVGILLIVTAVKFFYDDRHAYYN